LEFYTVLTHAGCIFAHGMESLGAIEFITLKFLIVGRVKVLCTNISITSVTTV
jgi:hypothetical protein